MNVTNEMFLMDKAITQLITFDPLWASKVLNLEVKVDENCPTAWTDGKSLGFNPKFFNKLNKKQQLFIVVHEAAHNFGMHTIRALAIQKKHGKSYNHTIMNIAADNEINWILSNAIKEEYMPNWEVPKSALMEPRFQNMAMEKIYEILYKESQSDQPGDPGGHGEVRIPKNEDGTPLSEGDIKELEADLKQQNETAAKIAKAAGKLPGNMDIFIKEMLKSQVDWRSLLWKYVQMNSKNEYSWRRRNRRMAAYGIAYPGKKSEGSLSIVLAMDISGSVSIKDLTIMSSEINAIISQFEVDLKAIWFDTRIVDSKEYTKDDYPIELKIKAGGGTDYRCIFSWIEKEQISPTVLVVLTDGECWNFPTRHPNYPVIWLGTQGKFDVPFGSVSLLG